MYLDNTFMISYTIRNGIFSQLSGLNVDTTFTISYTIRNGIFSQLSGLMYLDNTFTISETRKSVIKH